MPESSAWTERKRHSDEGHVAGQFNAQTADAQFQRDRARLIHCAAFRRLQSKTQVHHLGDGDFYRTRLTHSLEVAQLGSGIVLHLQQAQPQYAAQLPSPMLMEAICLAHDLGHPPFGHGGEAALNGIMRDFGGFEGNGQTLRIATRLGEYSESHGLDLTRRTLLGVLKYPALHRDVARYPNTTASNDQRRTRATPCKPPKCIHDEEGDILAWILAPFSPSDRALFRTLDFPPQGVGHGRTRYKAFDTSIMELADDIAYGVHDLEDAIALRLISRADWQAQVVDPAQALVWEDAPARQRFDALLHFATSQLFLGGDKPRKHAISRLVNFLIGHVHVVEQRLFASPMLDLQARMDGSAQDFLQLLKDFVMQYVILRPQLQELEFKGQQIVLQLFQVLLDNPQRLLPLEHQHLLRSGAPLQRTVCDFVASMTDTDATRRYGRLFAAPMATLQGV
ncbi:deoxyguanosinetriphosphate triphosphohydrolase [Lampropedia cohaerens]|uniref:Deoxyguanosinetriphosphate triphosphohydrolase-like protein n=1 Tax=Lampropedia cohaerens TaxID=1610491 RepID=A0A0U1PYV5_9BURK|nr:anti-phage deoxyguanosine triphosphatase [Lampropedia cohaerens]KKW67651.1 deoxyguanosinetriphosphate triphosphohydrolase [Lampropedia cohaerens]